MVLILCTVLAPLVARAQGSGPPPAAATLMRADAAKVTAAAGTTTEIAVALEVLPGWHVNANPPASEEMIPTTVELVSAPGLVAGHARYPAGRKRKLSFADEELLVYDGSVTALVPLVIARDAAPGPHTLGGRLRFQACNDQLCLPPVTVPFQVEIVVAAAGAATAGTTASSATDTSATSVAPPARDTTATNTSGFATAPPPGGQTGAAAPGGPSMADNPIARMFEHGSFVAFLWLFLIGLALNLTPCVYPMLGITVSIFGSRQSTAPLKAFALACVYVLGMATMYSTLGVAAALTGALFGGWLSNPWVLFGFGLMMVALALSMFGVYELNPPYWLTSRLGGSGATSVAGIFLSGLAVGVIAAPCTGAPVVALLALVGAKGDPMFGFLAFFVLALGLGAPYLLLGTFSNLLQRLPRSGLWMVWVKKTFGSTMLVLAAYFITIALRPAWLPWVVPSVTIIAGVYLGFFEHSVPSVVFRRMQRVLGAITIVAGAWFLMTWPSQARTLAFEPYAPATLASVSTAGKPVMLDFSADWCLPCHELERNTFTDGAVKAKARSFRLVRVDLTHYDSDESNRLRQRFGIRGVPTIVFLSPDGREVLPARVEGFLPPRRFIEHMALALEASRDVTR